MTNAEIRLINAIDRIKSSDEDYFILNLQNYVENFYIPAYLPVNEKAVVDILTSTLTGSIVERFAQTLNFSMMFHLEGSEGQYMLQLEGLPRLIDADHKLKYFQENAIKYPPQKSEREAVLLIPNHRLILNFTVRHSNDPIEFIYNSPTIMALCSAMAVIFFSKVKDHVESDFSIKFVHDYRHSLAEDLEDVLSQFQKIARNNPEKVVYPKLLVNQNVKENYKQTDLVLNAR